MDNNTALGAEKVREIIFISDAHEKFYYEKLKEVRCQDEYHKALCYCLGINNDTRRNVGHIYDFKTGRVKTECLREGWQTSGTLKEKLERMKSEVNNVERTQVKKEIGREAAI